LAGQGIIHGGYGKPRGLKNLSLHLRNIRSTTRRIYHSVKKDPTFDVSREAPRDDDALLGTRAAVTEGVLASGAERYISTLKILSNDLTVAGNVASSLGSDSRLSQAEKLAHLELFCSQLSTTLRIIWHLRNRHEGMKHDANLTRHDVTNNSAATHKKDSQVDLSCDTSFFLSSVAPAARFFSMRIFLSGSRATR